MNERKQVKVFLREVILASIFALIAISLVLVLSQDANSYGAASVLKMERLAEAPSPRLILVGGSGVAFNTDSAAIEKATHLHPVNMGLYAGFGMDFLLQQAASGAHKGDIILVMPEYDILDSAPAAEGFLMLEAIQQDPSLLRFMISNQHSIIDIVRQFPGWFSTRILSLAAKTPIGRHFVQEDTLYHRVYRASSFNTYGDMIGHMSESERLASSSIATATNSRDEINITTLNTLSAFINTQEAKGVTVIFSWPAVPVSYYEAKRNGFEAQEAIIEHVVTREHILGRQTDFIFQDSDFFDSIHHLAASARDVSTHRLIVLLKDWLSNNKNR